jgi:hypothetical protein
MENNEIKIIIVVLLSSMIILGLAFTILFIISKYKKVFINQKKN